MDLHMHTPASRDYEQPEIRYLDILRQAERRGLDIIAFTDHNTVNGYRNMQREVAELELLEKLGRMRADEMGRLNEYRRLLKKVLVLPGFEFTATFGFHIIGIFSPDKPLRDIEFILLQLRVPSRVIEQGLTEAGATSDVLTAYRMIDEAGGIAIAPHANSSNGVFMRGLNIGGQTRMAYTQDEHLSAIELTDLAKGRRSMAMWFNGSKPEYSRRMHILQGSDAHRLTNSPTEAKRLGLGERPSEVLLPELSFEALKDLLHSQDFSRERPATAVLDVPNDMLREAREKGNTATQSFHAALPKRGDRFTPILNDIVAFANGEGGAVYIGCEASVLKSAVGLDDIDGTSTELAQAVSERIMPALNTAIDVLTSDDVPVLRVSVSRGDNVPYAVDQNQFYVRSEAETHLAMRDEIVALVRHAPEQTSGSAGAHHRQDHNAEGRQAQHGQRQPQAQRQPQQAAARQQQAPTATAKATSQQHSQQGQRGNPSAQPQRGQNAKDQSRRDTSQPKASPAPATNGKQTSQAPANGSEVEAPKTPQASPPVEPQVEGSPRSGVEILAFEERDGMRHYTVRDLRNKSVVRNVTQKSARDLWLYAIMQHMNDVYDVEQITWQNERSILSRSQRAGKVRYDLALHDKAGKVHIFYGVADDAMDARWKELIQATMPPISEEPANPPLPDEQPVSAQPDLVTDASSQNGDGVSAPHPVSGAELSVEASIETATAESEPPEVSPNPDRSTDTSVAESPALTDNTPVSES
jgi:hypothetical protein